MYISEYFCTFARNFAQKGINMEEKFFTFEKIHKELMHCLSVEYKHYEKADELSYFLTHYIRPERIGKYSDVEWYRFGITSERLPEIIRLIENDIEALRVMVHFRDHSNEVLPLEVENEERFAFERSCCKEIYGLMQSLSARPKFNKDGEREPDITHIEQGYKFSEGEPTDISNWGACSIKLAEMLPHTNKDSHYDVFSLETILSAAAGEHDEIVWKIKTAEEEGDLETKMELFCDVEYLIKVLRSAMVLYENRSLLDKEYPIIQALFAMAVYFKTEPYDPDYNTKARQPLFDRIYIAINDYFMSLNKWFFSYGQLEDTVEAIRQLQADSEDGSMENIPQVIRERILNESSKDLQNDRLRIHKLRNAYTACKNDLGKRFKGGSQWFYIYKLMVENRTYEDKTYKLFLSDLASAGVPEKEMPNTDTFARKYSQMKEGIFFPNWKVKAGGRQATLDEGLQIARIAFGVLYGDV